MRFEEREVLNVVNLRAFPPVVHCMRESRHGLELNNGALHPRRWLASAFLNRFVILIQGSLVVVIGGQVSIGPPHSFEAQENPGLLTACGGGVR